MKDFFELFGISRAYQIDDTKLRKKYYEISRNIHPDLSSEKPQEGDLENNISFVNKAYKTLSEPFLRLQYILELEGYAQNLENSLSQDLLMEMMELHEEIDHVKKNEDEILLSNLRIKIQQLELEINKFFDPKLRDYDLGIRNSETLEKMVQFFIRLKYINRIKNNLNGQAEI